MMEKHINKELLSAMVDGELRDEELEQALAVAESAQGYADWALYHVVGDVLRSPDLAHHSQHDLLTGLRAQLAKEPAPQVVPAQLEQITAGMAPTGDGTVVALRDRAANSAVFRWKLAASFATVAAVAALGLNVWASFDVREQGMQMASTVLKSGGPVIVASENGDVLRDPRLDALLANQYQFASRASLQSPAEFLRNASFAARSGPSTAP